MGKFDKHVKFIEGLLYRKPEECTEAERAALYRTPLARDYAANVALLRAVTGAQFFEAHPQYVTLAEQGMALVEAEGKAEEAGKAGENGLRAELDELKALVAKLSKPAEVTAAPAADAAPAETPPAETPAE
jgi:hypothetical protein